jgi:hypothetical protein
MLAANPQLHPTNSTTLPLCLKIGIGHNSAYRDIVETGKQDKLWSQQCAFSVGDVLRLVSRPIAFPNPHEERLMALSDYTKYRAVG